MRTCASSSLEALSALELRRLGRSELLVPEVTLGTMTWGKQNSEAEAREQMAWALSQGLRFWDTAEMYPGATLTRKKHIGTLTLKHTEWHLGPYVLLD